MESNVVLKLGQVIVVRKPSWTESGLGFTVVGCREEESHLMYELLWYEGGSSPSMNGKSSSMREDLLLKMI